MSSLNRRSPGALWVNSQHYALYWLVECTRGNTDTKQLHTHTHRLDTWKHTHTREHSLSSSLTTTTVIIMCNRVAERQHEEASVLSLVLFSCFLTWISHQQPGLLWTVIIHVQSWNMWPPTYCANHDCKTVGLSGGHGGASSSWRARCFPSGGGGDQNQSKKRGNTGLYQVK